MENTYTNVYDNIWQCNDCGAHATGSHDKIKHFKTCVPGESQKWQNFYENEDDEMDELRLMQDPICSKHHF